MQLVIKSNGDVEIKITATELEKHGNILEIFNNLIPAELSERVNEKSKEFNSHYNLIRQNPNIDPSTNDVSDRIVNINLDNIAK